MEVNEQIIDLTKIRELLPDRAVMIFRHHRGNKAPYLEVDVKIVPYMEYEEHDPLINKIIDLLGEDLMEVYTETTGYHFIIYITMSKTQPTIVIPA
jgi:hypothetical protein